MIQPISITAISSISALGTSQEEVWSNYQKEEHFFELQKFDDNQEWVAALNRTAKQEIEQLRNSDSKYKKLDDSVLFAVYASRKAIAQADWKSNTNFGINIGSSRGATALFETYHSEYLKNKKVATLTSPTTTLGNISSWVAHDLNSKGPEISHSITCSTALHAMLNGIAWLQSGMADTFLVGGSEAPLTPFTIAQMKALKIYSDVTPNAVEAQSKGVTERNRLVAEGSGLVTERSRLVAERNRLVAERSRLVAERSRSYPCQALNLNKKQNTLVLGEGAAVACLEKGVSENALAVIEGVGYATEVLKHNISISSDAECFQRSMKMALGNINPDEVDAIVMHAPGTIKGDLAEYNAIQEVFCNKVPFLTTNKWKVGHTFGTSGMLSVEMAVLMLHYQKSIGTPFNLDKPISNIKKVIVNAVGFGGNAVSILLSN